MDELIKNLAKETSVTMDSLYICYSYHIEQFVEKVRREERVAMLKKITGCENQPSELGTVTVEYMERQIAREREACAQICDDEGRIVPITRNEILNKQCYKLADLIRARTYK